MSRRYHLEARELAAAEAAGPGRVPPTPRPAAGLILVRSTPGGPQVLLVRRRTDVAFAAGAYVFPGGTLDAEDADPEWSSWIAMPPPATLSDVGATEEWSPRAFVVAALRETFEETGVLLAPGVRSAELKAERAALVDGRRTFLSIVSSLGVKLAGDRLVLCARWITPESLSRRYDARFFLAPSPHGIEVAAEAGELVEHLWIEPGTALERYFDGRFPMLFPTARTLGSLGELDAELAAWLDHYRAARIVPILPRLRRIEGKVIPLVPGEPGYDDRDGDG